MKRALLSAIILAIAILAIAGGQFLHAPGMHRIGFVNSGPEAPNAANLAAFRAGLAELGYVEGRNLILDIRWANQDVEQLPILVSELLALKPEVIVSTGGPATIHAVKAANVDIPVVFVTGNPIAEGFVTNLSHPGGNMTGVAALGNDLELKRLEYLTQLLPAGATIGIIWNPSLPYMEAAVQTLRKGAHDLGVRLVTWQARNRQELDLALDDLALAKVDAFFVVGDPVLGYERHRIVEFSNQHRLPSVFFWREFADIGGLASYGTSLPAAYRRAAVYVDKILKGAAPGNLPIEQVDTFELVINARTAASLGITIPNALMLRADEVIR